MTESPAIAGFAEERSDIVGTTPAFCEFNSTAATAEKGTPAPTVLPAAWSMEIRSGLLSLLKSPVSIPTDGPPIE